MWNRKPSRSCPGDPGQAWEGGFGAEQGLQILLKAMHGALLFFHLSSLEDQFYSQPSQSQKPSQLDAQSPSRWLCLSLGAYIFPVLLTYLS